ncbi:hypothetical protein K402DRAFT_460426 [Aulographum hederae CBS 113979]|uniref:Uncharacterized protein n=1 Tax=Aulographum hederae CBS 113979 TaxID=1176131 RepID=A0A6G1HBD8_9PEZI|nr:hypothetical protein K402DRAFT_460426 [Aulographum hederae CBS 113979]
MAFDTITLDLTSLEHQENNRPNSITRLRQEVNALFGPEGEADLMNYGHLEVTGCWAAAEESAEIELEEAYSLIVKVISSVQALSHFNWMPLNFPIQSSIIEALPARVSSVSVSLARGDSPRVPPKQEVLFPLVFINGLRSLSLVDCEESYQTVLWSICLRNQNLKTVRYMMASNYKPKISSGNQDAIARVGREVAAEMMAREVARGGYRALLCANNYGRLNSAFGWAECIEFRNRRFARNALGHTANNVLPIEELTLKNVVVDELSLAEILDNLKKVVFKGVCFDAGARFAEEATERGVEVVFEEI